MPSIHIHVPCKFNPFLYAIAIAIFLISFLGSRRQKTRDFTQTQEAVYSFPTNLYSRESNVHLAERKNIEKQKMYTKLNI